MCEHHKYITTLTKAGYINLHYTKKQPHTAVECERTNNNKWSRRCNVVVGSVGCCSRKKRQEMRTVVGCTWRVLLGATIQLANRRQEGYHVGMHMYENPKDSSSWWYTTIIIAPTLITSVCYSYSASHILLSCMSSSFRNKNMMDDKMMCEVLAVGSPVCLMLKHLQKGGQELSTVVWTISRRVHSTS